MYEAGLRQFNKKIIQLGGKSVFAEHWREFARYNPQNKQLMKQQRKLVKNIVKGLVKVETA